MTPRGSLGLMLIIGGLVLLGVGLFLLLGLRIPFLGKLPGDIRIEKDNWSVYFPITTCILLSLLLSLIFYLVQRFK